MEEFVEVERLRPESAVTLGRSARLAAEIEMVIGWPSTTALPL